MKTPLNKPQHFHKVAWKARGRVSSRTDLQMAVQKACISNVTCGKTNRIHTDFLLLGNVAVTQHVGIYAHAVEAKTGKDGNSLA